MKRILFFDMWSSAGHIVFNNIHLRALGQLGDVYTIFKEGYDNFDYPNVYHYLDVPSRFYKAGEGYLMSRLRYARMIRWVWRNVKKEKWDYIILSSYDPLAFYLSQRFKNSLAIDHYTIELLDSKILGFPFRHLGKGIKHIVFNDYMKSRLNTMGFDDVKIVPHGFLPINCEELSEIEEREMRHKYLLNEDDKIIFLPSLSTSYVDSIGELIYNDDFNNFLKEQGLKLITKSLVKRDSKSNIIIVDGYLPPKDYNYLFLRSSCNILIYSKDFKYRTSGVLNECFANNIPCVFFDNPALKVYLPFINNRQCVFQNVEGLKVSILAAIHSDKKSYYNNLKDIQNPLTAWKQIIE